jgi:sulfur carrier protein
MNLSLNGRPVELPTGATVADALLSIGRRPEERGTAVALNGEVVARASWPHEPLEEGDRLEVLTAVQGG